MKVEVLCSAMGLNSFSIVKSLNLQTDSVIINQCEKNEYNEQNDGFKVRMYSFAERGIGVSRNSALIRANGDILLFADDDITYREGYEKMIVGEFEKHPDADMLLFNIEYDKIDRPEYQIKKVQRVGRFNCLRYGAVRMAVKREFLYKNNIWFSLMFGGGAKYNSGEDTMFIVDCLRHGAKIYAVPETLCHVSFETSSWFRGFDRKYFNNVGVLMSAIYGCCAYLLVLPVIYKKKHLIKEKMTFSEAVKCAYSGISEWRKG